MEHQSVALIMEHVDKLAAKLGIAGTEIFSWYTKQIRIDFYRQFIWIFIFAGLAIYMFSLYKKWKKNEDSKVAEDMAKAKADGKEYKVDTDMSNSDVAQIVTFILFVLTCLTVGVMLFCRVPELINIEYHAFNDLLSNLTK